MEQAKALADKNSRSLRKFEINSERKKYQLKQAEYQRVEVFDGYNSLSARYDNLAQKYSSLQEKLDQGDASVVAEMGDIQAQMRDIEKEMQAQYGKIESTSDEIDVAKNNYNDVIKEEENYRKYLEYIVEGLYTTILNLENSLLALKKEYEIKQYLIDVERKKAQLGTSSQFEVSRLEAGINSLNKSIIELTNQIKIKKGQLNDILGRNYDDELKPAPFEIPTALEIPKYNQVLSDAMQTHDTLSRLNRSIGESEGKLDDEDDHYENLLLRLDIEEKKLQLEDEKSGLKEAINNLITNVKLKQEDFRLAGINFENAQKTYEWDKKRYEIGLISKITFLESQLNYLNMKSKAVSSGYAFFLAQRSLQLAQDGIVLN